MLNVNSSILIMGNVSTNVTFICHWPNLHVNSIFKKSASILHYKAKDKLFNGTDQCFDALNILDSSGEKIS